MIRRSHGADDVLTGSPSVPLLGSVAALAKGLARSEPMLALESSLLCARGVIGKAKSFQEH